MGGRFPALAVFGLPALSVVLALFVLWGLRPWEDNSADPHEAPLGIEMAVTGGKALPRASTARVAAGVAVPVGPKVEAAQRVGGDAGPNPSPAPSSDGAPATIVVAPARAIAVAGPPPATGVAPGPGEGGVPSAGASPVVAPTEGAPSAVTTPAGTSGSAPGGPVTAGLKPPVLESCEGDEYLITITFLDAESSGDEAPVEIVLQRFDEGDSADELQLEGDLGDVRTLASTLEGEGSCVTVEVAQTEGQEGAEEVPGASEEELESGEGVTEPSELPVPSSP